MLCQLHPLEINPKTGEPFLRLGAPYQNIILTPPRQGDQSALIQHMNDPAIYRWLNKPPVPFLLEHADARLQFVKGESDATLEFLRKSAQDFPDGPLQFVDACPVRYLREVKEDGTDVLLGDVGFRRWKQTQEDDAKKQAGDPTIQYAIGDWLAVSHHGKGIMTAAIGLLMTAWAIPRMGVRYVVAHTLAGNIGSDRVLEKNGFVNIGVFYNKKIAGGEGKFLTFLEWRHEEVSINET
ncbi:GNAT domain-containing protein [Suillus bovinus]|uniref:GNAT domain-containing protein n=1 Tax=Suillus bovinus TaxID=48563 RepID=UPI001B88170D|nr:GNAT domain-containing protein [Suillus bovinus]KAG2137623.1 GNAT domain-containing protein [Suillus bovinus]